MAQYESYRDEDGNVKTRYCGYLGKEGEEKGVPLPKKSAHVETPLYPEISKRAGDVKLMWQLPKKNSICPELSMRSVVEMDILEAKLLEKY